MLYNINIVLELYVLLKVLNTGNITDDSLIIKNEQLQTLLNVDCSKNASDSTVYVRHR